MITIPDTFLLQTTERRVTSVRTSHRMNLIFILCFLSSLTDGERIPQNADEQINKHMIRQMTRKMNGKSSNTTMIKQQNERERERIHKLVRMRILLSIIVSSVTFVFQPYYYYGVRKFWQNSNRLEYKVCGSYTVLVRQYARCYPLVPFQLIFFNKIISWNLLRLCCVP